ncbi:hypothetical protein JCM8547_004281 [Rhodosporidiobolus lusitaniae]
MGKKAPKSTPRTTDINPASVSSSLTAFSHPAASSSSTALYYAHVQQAPDAHTVRVFAVDSGKCVSRWASNADDGDELRVKSVEWCYVPSASPAGSTTAVDGEGKRGKKRRKSDGGGAVDSPAKPVASSSLKPQPAQLTLALGLENGSVLLWHPLGTGSRTLSHPASISPVTAVASPVSSSVQEDGHLWTAHADGSVRVWDTVSGNVVGKVAGLKEEQRWDDLLVRYEPASEEGGKRTVHLVLSHLSLHAYSLQLAGPSKKEGKVRDLKAVEVGRCTGHVEPCSIRWTGLSSSTSSSFSDMTDDATFSSSDKLSFLSFSPTDRFVQLWSLPLASPSSPANGTLLARLALDSGVSSASLSPLLSSSSSSSSSSQTLAAIDSVTGNVTLTSLPLSFTPAESAITPSKKGKKTTSGVVALEALCEITAPAQGGRAEAGVAEAVFRAEEEGKVLLCRGGVKPVFEVAAFKEEGNWIKKLELARGSNGLLVSNGVESSAGAPQPTRYSEHQSSSVAAGTAAEAANSDDEDEEAVNTGSLDVDAAEPSLAERLKAMNVSQKRERRKAAKKAAATARAGDDVEVASESSGSEMDDDLDFDEEDDEDGASAVPATTLTTTLIQALHSQDGPLLESCLAHSNPVLVRSTVKRLPSGGLVLSLLQAIVDRLGREKKRREGMASVKRARALVGWLKETLIVHVGFLVTIPSLVNRLSTLHASLTQRLALQQPLLALHGRLELVMSQIDLRQDRSAAASAAKQRQAPKKEGRRYVEGESTDEDDDEEEEEDGEGEEVDEDDSEGDVEDIILGGGGEDFGSENDEDDDVDSAFEDEEDGAGSKATRHKANGIESLLDLEAEDASDFDEDEENADNFGEEDDDEEEAGEDSEFEA